VLLLDAAPLSPSRQAGSADGFAGAAAHDLRNPLATVKLNLQVLARQPAAGGDERTARHLAIALREVETLERGLEALAECGRARVPVAVPAELPRALDEVARRLAPELGASPRVEAEAGLPRLAVDEGRLALALSGLARLAARDGLEGEVVLCGRAGKGRAGSASRSARKGSSRPRAAAWRLRSRSGWPRMPAASSAWSATGAGPASS
jgi:signal transduction histidine kinase